MDKMSSGESLNAGPVSVGVRRLDPRAVLPAQAHPGDAGWDVCALDEAVLAPGERRLFGTGLSLEIPEGWEIQVRPRSGLALKHGVTVLNTPGTVDAGYRGEIKVLLINLGSEPFAVSPGLRLAQLVLGRVWPLTWDERDELGESARGAGGYGSSGTH